MYIVTKYMSIDEIFEAAGIRKILKTRDHEMILTLTMI